MKPWICEKLSQGGHTHALWIYSLGHVLVKIDILQGPDFSCMQSKVFKVNFFKGFQLLAQIMKKKKIYIYIFYSEVFLGGGCED